MFEHEKKATQQNPAAGRKTNRKLSISEMIGGMNIPMSGDGSGAAIKDYIDAFNATLTKEQKLVSDGYKLAYIDGSAEGINLTTIVVYQVNAESVIGYHLLVEATCGSLINTQIRTSQGENVEVPFTTSDLYGKELIDANFTALARTHDLGELAFENAGGLVIPSELNSKEDPESIRQILFLATSAINTVRSESDENAIRWSLDAVDTTNLNFLGELDYGEHTIIDATGMPIRADITMRVNTQQGNQSNGSQVLTTSNRICETSGYVDFTYAGHTEQIDPATRQRILGSQVYTGTFNITHTPSSVSISPELQLHALLSTYNLSIGAHTQVWTNVFNTPKGGRDIRALSYECMAEEPLDPNDKTFDPQAFLSQYVDRDLTYVLQVQDTGELSYLHSAIRAAADNSESPETMDARRYVYDVAATLLGDSFTNNWSENDPISMVETNSRIFIGYWYDSNGNRRDLREIDPVWAWTHYGATDEELCVEFANTFKANHGDLGLRLANRKKLIVKMLSADIVIKGYATPVILLPQWLEVMNACAAKCGAQVQFGSLSYGEHQTTREYATFRQYQAVGQSYHSQDATVNHGVAGNMYSAGTWGRV